MIAAGGRYMNDVWSFDFAALAWKPIACHATPESPDSPLPAVAGHTLIHWNNALLVIGGHVKVVICFAM